MSYWTAAYHRSAQQSLREQGTVFHCGYPELRERHDLAIPMDLGTIRGVPVIFWSRRPAEYQFRPGETVEGLLASVPWGVDKQGGTVRYYKDFRKGAV